MALRHAPRPWRVDTGAMPAESAPPSVDLAAPRPAAPREPRGSGFAATAVVVVMFGIAMAFLESAVVVYLQRALGMQVGVLFPLQDAGAVGDLAAIEVGREAATMVMLVAIGWLAGRGWVERLAWTAVAFGTWDIAYYAWLWVFVGWPPSLGTWDLLFLIPVPWAGPVATPVIVSLALVGFGLWAARRLRAGRAVHVGRAQLAAGILGGTIVVVAFCWNARLLMDGGIPTDFPWLVFGAGLGIAAWGAVSAMRPRTG
jgi:hypothetical protein